MSDEHIEDQLAARLHEAADGIDGAGVTRAGVAASVARQREERNRRRTLLVGAAAVVALLGGLAVAATSGDDPGEQVVTTEPPAVTTTCPVEQAPTGDAGWFRLTSEQAEALLAAGAITADEAAGHAEHAVLLQHADLAVLDDPEIGPFGQQLFDLGYEDSAGLALLRSEGLLTAEQEADIAEGVAPVLDQAQADRVFAAYPDVLAVAAGGQPFPTNDVTFTPSGGATTTLPPSDDAGCSGPDPSDEVTSTTA